VTHITDIHCTSQAKDNKDSITRLEVTDVHFFNLTLTLTLYRFLSDSKAADRQEAPYTCNSNRLDGVKILYSYQNLVVVKGEGDVSDSMLLFNDVISTDEQMIMNNE
jgi:hypothetical protein